MKLLQEDISKTTSIENLQETVVEETRQPCASFEASSIRDSLMSHVSSKKSLALADQNVLEKETLRNINQVSEYKAERDLSEDKLKASLKNSQDFKYSTKMIRPSRVESKITP